MPSTPTSDTYVTREARAALFRPAAEQLEEVEAAVQGTLPAWLSGSLLLNGGGDYTGLRHMFDGFAVISKLRFSAGRVFQSQRYVQSSAYRAYKSTGRIKWREFGTPVPTSGPVDQALQVAKVLQGLVTGGQIATDNPSVSIMPLPDGTVLAMSETVGSEYRIDPATLETLGQVRYTDKLGGTMTTAHPSILPDGRIINFCRKVPFDGIHVYQLDPVTMCRTQLAFIPDRDPLHPAWIHDFGCTHQHAVIFEMPLLMDLPSISGGPERQYMFMDWKPEARSRVHVVSLDGSQRVRTFTAPPFWSFHTGNAFESDDGATLHLDMSYFDDAVVLNQLRLDTLLEYPGKDIAPSGYHRWTIPLDGSTTELQPPEPLVDAAAIGHYCEFPGVAPARRGQSYRYAYMCVARRPTTMINALAKLNTHTGQVKLWHEDGAAPGELSFLPSPTASSEDDGVVVTTVMDGQGRSFCLVLDGRSFEEVARAYLPVAVPNRFHGAYLPEP